MLEKRRFLNSILKKIYPKLYSIFHLHSINMQYIIRLIFLFLYLAKFSLCEESSFGECTRPVDKYLIESTLGQRNEIECQDLGNKQFSGRWNFYTFSKVQSKCSFYRVIELQDYIDTCNRIIGSPNHHTKICVKPTVNSCNVSIFMNYKIMLI